MEKIIKIQNKKSDTLDLEYVLGNVCNYKCHYCFPGSNEGNYRWPDVNLVTNNIKKLCRYYSSYKSKFHLKLVGGEPTLWPELITLVKELKNNFDIKISLSTNASRTLRYWDEIADYFDDIMISVHHQYADLDHIIHVANLIYEKNTSVLAVNVLMDPTQWSECVRIVDYLYQNSKHWLLATMPVTFDGVTKYTAEQNDFLKTKNKRMPPDDWVKKLIEKGKLTTINHNKIIATFNNSEEIEVDGRYIVINKLNNFYGFSCNLGVDRIFINKEGLLTGGCGQQIFDNKLNINDQNFQFELANIKPKAVICKQLICSCIPDILITKCK